jgi:hypothetical protein
MTFYEHREQPMTESEWFACTEPTPMLEFLEDKVSNRKLRLLACAVVRHVPFSRDGMTIWELLPRCEWFRSPEFPGVDCHSVIETAERMADGEASEGEWKASVRHTGYINYRAEPEAWGDVPGSHLRYALTDAVQRAVSYTANKDSVFLCRYFLDFFHYLRRHDNLVIHTKFERRVCGIIRDAIGNPFQPPTIDPSWLTDGTIPISEFIYKEQAFDRMPILGDVLENAGCDNDLILSHCRSQSRHARGCWVVDAILGKS